MATILAYSSNSAVRLFIVSLLAYLSWLIYKGFRPHFQGFLSFKCTSEVKLECSKSSHQYDSDGGRSLPGDSLTTNFIAS